MKQGFTLIELLVATGIMILMAGSILVNYTTYNENQKLKESALTLKNNLRLAQQKAFSVQKPSSGCTQLLAYAVSFTTASYTIQAQCTEGLVGETQEQNLLTGVSFSPVPALIVFEVLTGHSVTDVIISLSGVSKMYRIQVSQSGDITDLGFQ